MFVCVPVIMCVCLFVCAFGLARTCACVRVCIYKRNKLFSRVQEGAFDTSPQLSLPGYCQPVSSENMLNDESASYI